MRWHAFCLWVVSGLIGTGAVAAEPARILIVVGPSNHPPGTHEVAAGARVIEYCLENAQLGKPIEADVVEGWPSDAKTLAGVRSVVFSGDRFPLAELPDADESMEQLSQLMANGCGILCFHYATGLNDAQVPDDGAHPLLEWMGGYFATRCKHHQSIAKIFPEARIVPTDREHPVLRGCRPFTIHDEPYINNYFGPQGIADNVTPLATAMLPPENPQEEVVAWSVERADGGRGMGIVMPHFYKNWQVDELRKMILNGVAWTAQLDVPAQGIEVELPGLEVFEPESVEFRPRR